MGRCGGLFIFLFFFILFTCCYINSDIFKSNIRGNHCQTAIIPQHIKASAGCQPKNSRLPFAIFFQSINPLAEFCHFRSDLIFLSEDFCDCQSIVLYALNQSLLCIRCQINDRGDFRQLIIGFAQSSANKDNIWVSLHNRF